MSASRIARKSDVVMIQVPSGAVAKWAEIVLAEGSRIIDIGADIRFRDVKVWEKWYGDKHTNPQMTHDAVYSMPEMNRELAKEAHRQPRLLSHRLHPRPPAHAQDRPHR